MKTEDLDNCGVVFKARTLSIYCRFLLDLDAGCPDLHYLWFCQSVRANCLGHALKQRAVFSVCTSIIQEAYQNYEAGSKYGGKFTEEVIFMAAVP
jgi:hypothetical protein